MEPILITKANRNIVENNRDNIKKKELHDSKIAEIEEKKYKQDYEQIENFKLAKELL